MSATRIFGLAWVRPSLCAHPARIAHEQAQRREHQAREGDEVKRHAPAEVRADRAPKDVAERAANRDREIEIGQHATALFDRVEVGDDRRRGRPVAGFADADEHARDEQHGERPGQSRPATGQAPHRDARAHEQPAGKPIRQQAENGRHDHVTHEKGRGEPAGLGESAQIVGRKERLAYFGFDGGKNLAVDIVEQIDRQQQRERAVRAGSGGGRFVRHALESAPSHAFHLSKGS